MIASYPLEYLITRPFFDHDIHIELEESCGDPLSTFRSEQYKIVSLSRGKSQTWISPSLRSVANTSLPHQCECVRFQEIWIIPRGDPPFLGSLTTRSPPTDSGRMTSTNM